MEKEISRLTEKCLPLPEDVLVLSYVHFHSGVQTKARFQLPNWILQLKNLGNLRGKKKKGVGFFFKYVEFVISTSVCLYFDRNCMKYRQGPELQCSCRPKYVYV